MLKHSFISIVEKFSSEDAGLAEKLWQEVQHTYSHKNRHYHNLEHIEGLYQSLLAFKEEVKDWDTLLMSVVYHDIVCNPAGMENEEKSACFAQRRLSSIGFPEYQISKCVCLILATKGHCDCVEDHDTNLFTDANLSILGTEWATYADYASKIRREYGMFPDFVYRPGRRKVLRRYLDSKRIFKTDTFYERYEQKAHENLKLELEYLERGLEHGIIH